MPFTIRLATAADRAFVLEAAKRLAAFGPPSWRTSAEIVSAEVRSLERFFATPAPGAHLLVAEDEDGSRARAGFVYLEVLQDYFTGEPHGHVAILAVTAAAEGRGAAAALMRAAEDWARAEGFGRLTLNAFDGNVRARRMYEHLGYRAELVRYVKLIDG
jgi:GNAT superfamily N-acetyltransferase